MRGLAGCIYCHGEGTIVNKFGLKIECSCVVKVRAQENENQAQKVINEETKGVPGGLQVADVIKKFKLIPSGRMADDFDDKHVKIVALQMCDVTGCSINSTNLNTYIETLEGLIDMVSRGQKIPASYLIGAPNGFGKTTFANTLIREALRKGSKVVPYITLSELSEMWKDHMSRVANGKEIRKNNYFDAEFIDEYFWSDYVDADVVVTSLTSTQDDCMLNEMQVLLQLLQLRARRELPTIVMTRNSLDWYKNNPDIKKYFIDELLETQNEKSYVANKYKISDIRYDKLIHVSVWLSSIRKDADGQMEG